MPSSKTNFLPETWRLDNARGRLQALDYSSHPTNIIISTERKVVKPTMADARYQFSSSRCVCYISKPNHQPSPQLILAIIVIVINVPLNHHRWTSTLYLYLYISLTYRVLLALTLKEHLLFKDRMYWLERRCMKHHIYLCTNNGFIHKCACTCMTTRISSQDTHISVFHLLLIILWIELCKECITTWSLLVV